MACSLYLAFSFNFCFDVFFSVFETGITHFFLTFWSETFIFRDLQKDSQNISWKKDEE